MDEECVELNSSELGTKEYWTSIYKRDIENFENHKDFGDIWFGEDSELRIIKWLHSNIAKESSILDLGCGNGMMLIELARGKFTNLTGIDYCEDAINLAQRIADEQRLSNIIYEVADIFNDNYDKTNKYDIVHDKGTYDAISLHPCNPLDKRKNYIENIWNFLKVDGYFIITSCNWCSEELQSHVESYFDLHYVIPTPTFKFGGKEGNLVTSIVFQKKRPKQD